MPIPIPSTRNSISALVLGIAVLAFEWNVASAQEPANLAAPRTQAVDFVRDVMPIFVSRCLDCHGQDVQESHYRLDRRDSALGSGDYGDPPIIPGDASSSALYRYVAEPDAELIMPPVDSGVRLDTREREILRQWIDEGAIWPDEASEGPNAALATSHWSFQPLQPIVVPNVPDASSAPLVNEIDQFIARKLAEHDLAQSPPADRRTLIRRLYLDMHGLLPTRDEVTEFLDDEEPDAWQRAVERALASPRYGERWARHWLDVVRFGESTGYEVNRDRSNAWYYRDYVIEALNQDKPFNDFVCEQLAGDVLGVDEATGFLVGGPFDIVKSPDINLTLMQRQDELADYVNTTSTTFLGLTVACARCHNHKFDPILQKDYYAFQAVFAGVQHGERPLTHRVPTDLQQRIEAVESRVIQLTDQLADLEKRAADRVVPAESPLLPPVKAEGNVETFAPIEARFVRFTSRQTNQYEPCLDELEVFTAEGTNVALATAGGVPTSSGDYPASEKHQLKHINDGVYGNDHSWISNTTETCWIQVEWPQPHTIERVVWARDRQKVFSDRLAWDYVIEVSLDGEAWTEVASSSRRQPFLIEGREPEGAFIVRLPEAEAGEASRVLSQLRAAREERTQLQSQIPLAYVGTFKEPDVIHRLYRGEPQQPREVVAPDGLTVLGSIGLSHDTDEATRRLRFAEWIASEANPLTARVIVNRVWQYHFGQGIVATPSDLGVNGLPPTHPELLDWLASEFMAHDWSLKWLHRQILMSATYRQSSAPRDDGQAADADSRWLWRFPPRRLEAEAIRDCVLQVTGKLDLRMGGPGFLLFEVDRENVHHYFPLTEFGPEHFRRMVYMTKIRQEQEGVFGVFDCPDGGQTIPTRSRSTTPLQALNLLNSPFMIEQAEFLAARLNREYGDEPGPQIDGAYDLVFSREPTPQERSDALAFWNDYGGTAFCRALLNANEFLFME